MRKALLFAVLAACASERAAPPDAPPPPPPDAAGVTQTLLPFGPGSHGVHDAQVVGAVLRFTGTRGAEVGQVVLEGPKRWSFVPLPKKPEPGVEGAPLRSAPRSAQPRGAPEPPETEEQASGLRPQASGSGSGT